MTAQIEAAIHHQDAERSRDKCQRISRQSPAFWLERDWFNGASEIRAAYCRSSMADRGVSDADQIFA